MLNIATKNIIKIKKMNKKINKKVLGLIFLMVVLLGCSAEDITIDVPTPEPDPKPKPKPREIFTINDPLFKDQWHLHNTKYPDVPLKDGGTTKIDINVLPVWNRGYYGKGIKIGVFDNAVDHTHPDLKDNLPPENLVSYFPADEVLCDRSKGGGGSHGTAVAGLIAARNNDIDVVGVAPRATLYSYVVIRESQYEDRKPELLSVDLILKMLQRPEATQIGVYNGSLSDYTDSEMQYMTHPSEYAVLTEFDRLTNTGFNGLGTSFVFAAGNMGSFYGSSANNQYLNHYATIAVNSIIFDGSIVVSKKGARRNRLLMGEIGPNIWLVAPTAPLFVNKLVTTDIAGICGKIRGDAGDIMSATSGAAPLVSGVVALLREARPQLTWRDVKLILAESAKKIATNLSRDTDWKATGKMYHNPSKIQYYQRVKGFGMVDAGAAFKMAKTWTLLPPMKTETFEQTTELKTPDRDTLYETSLSVTGSAIRYLEFVELQMEIDRSEDLSLSKWQLSLISPSGRVADIYSDYDNEEEAMILQKGLTKLTFAANAFLGSWQINGNWKLRLRIKNAAASNTGTINAIKNWKLVLRGH